jgi:triosephosphate isomerase (TIM)
MSERNPLVAGNWKMNGDAASLDLLLDGVLNELSVLALKRCSVLVFPSYVYLDQVAQKLRGSIIGVGSQDVDQRAQGAVTGGVSAAMVKDAGCEFSLVGHSERRTLFSEPDELIADKFEQCASNGLVPIVCVGETLEERRQDRTMEVVTRQLRAVTSRVGLSGFDGAMVAYEPVWAIGTGESATPEQAEDVHAGLRKCLAELDEGLSSRTRILYGGSVTADNAVALFGKENVDGALVGGASLKANSFAEICKAAEES